MTFPPAAAVITVRKFFGTRPVFTIALILSPRLWRFFKTLPSPAIGVLAPALRISAGRRASACRRWGKISRAGAVALYDLSLIHISEPTRLGMISYAVFCLK